MKGEKKLLIVAILLLLITVSFGTYAIYKSSATGTGTVTAAAWNVTVNQANIATTNTFTLGDITWTSNVSKVAGKIAPGDEGTINIVIHNGSEVDIVYAVSLASVNTGNTRITVEPVTTGADTGTIAYGGADVTVQLKVKWLAVDDVDANSEDVTFAGTEISIPVTVTATQRPGV